MTYIDGKPVRVFLDGAEITNGFLNFVPDDPKLPTVGTAFCMPDVYAWPVLKKKIHGTIRYEPMG